MKQGINFLCLFTLLSNLLYAQEITFDKQAELKQAYLKQVDSETLLPMNDLNMEFGYVLYEAEIVTESESEELELENVRDYAAVYVDGKLQVTLTGNRKKIAIKANPGKHLLQLYVENIGRITYGPEITDNSKGLFGEVTLNGNDIEKWKITPLNIKKYPVKDLKFDVRNESEAPIFYK